MLQLLKQKFSKKNLSIIVAFVVCALLIFVIYTTSSSRFTLGNVVVCKNLDKSMLPIDVIKAETPSSDRVILCFDYSKANIGQTLRIIWYYNDKQITDDTLKLSNNAGTRSLALLANDGSFLPQGAYCVKIFLGDNLLKQVSFIIS